MKLYSLPHSPYAARVRMQIYKKQLNLKIVAPEIPLKTDEFKAAYPMGKVPLLEISATGLLPESTAIAEYLEDVFPDNPCRPSDPYALSITRATVSFANSHFGPSLFPLFKNMAQKDAHSDKSTFTAPLCAELDKLNRWMSVHKSDSFDIGDFALASSIWYATTLAPFYDKSDVLADYPLVKSWWESIIKEPYVQKVLTEMAVGFAEFSKKLKN
ncbi:glutathione S-transferase family protein [Aliiglaciecola sp. 2_MG-2023]|uniref:glutathione S-transferase family protein n=1 Tax=unclassified Aliiglaciecola TaxID=2593648 RepID=UPI0026E1629C|nr:MULTISPECIES: glutathione S-transferase family protein [unclassified Aliiglaciecola]MDO6710696.1 glutathione S-transferase family protein [Aliiglaciecola sp. 2_MG-2023]MDO6751896.1 glutathione S-transferase family protein [Aliiglaciecola sp. 1_MG-2023]